MERIIVINQHLISLTVVREEGCCDKCGREDQMRLLIKKNDQQKYYCQTCANNLLDQLAHSNYQFTSKEIIISELKNELSKKLWADYYSNKKPTCFSCVSLGIKESEYRFCGDNCLVPNWIQYHGQNYLKTYE